MRLLATSVSFGLGRWVDSKGYEEINLASSSTVLNPFPHKSAA